jgi:hypothetical protein
LVELFECREQVVNHVDKIVNQVYDMQVDRHLPVLTSVLRAATWRSEPAIAHVERHVLARTDNMTTESIDRVVVTLADGTTQSVVAKTLRPVASSPAFAEIPEDFHEMVQATLDWRDEPTFWRCGAAGDLPAPMRVPQLFEIEDQGHRVVIWMEDVADVVPWTSERYERTAWCLGAMAGRHRAERATDQFGIGPRDIGDLFFGKIMNLDLPMQADPAFWNLPAIRDCVDADYRTDLFRLAEAMPAMIARLADLPSALCHGDACPANFLEPGDGTVVAIDWSYAHRGNPGSDLGQLLAGRFESGAADADDVESIAAAILPAFLRGMASEQVEVDPARVEQAWATHLAIRSVFMALTDPLPHVRADERAEVLRTRARLGRFGLDLALRHA